jgi:predicted esterase YcpF (UPF0227 family)
MADGISDVGSGWEIKREHFAELEAFNVVRVTEPQRYFLLVQSGDELLDWREAVAFYGGAWQLVQGGGNHAFQHFETQISPILRFSGIADS